MKTKPVYTLIAILVTLTLVLTACGGPAKAPAANISVRLKWTPQVQFAGVYVADKEGFYGEENLTVKIDPVDFNEIDSVKKVLDGQDTFGIASADEIIAARSKGLPVKAIAVVFRISPLLLMSVDNVKIAKPEDLYGKTVAVHAGQASVVYSAFINKTGLDASQINLVEAKAFDILECLSSADVCTGYATDAVIAAQLKGHETSALLFGDYGVPFYADVIFTTDDLIAKDPALVERFLRATLKGWQTAIENPQKGVDDTVFYASDLDPVFQLRSMQATIPLVDTGTQPLGVMEPAAWQTMYEILLEQKAISAFDITTAYTSQFMDAMYK
jgi:NitT/TauT family transport system substrate-binding protein